MGATTKAGKSGGVSGGKKGKKSGCPPGDAAICLEPSFYELVKEAFDNAIISSGDPDGCLAGFRRVCLKRDKAFSLLHAISLGLHRGSSKKKKGNGKGK